MAVDPRRTEQAPVSVARSRFRRVLSALRLFERGGYSLGPVAWIRSESGAWRTSTISISGRPRQLTLVPAAQEEELRAFCRLVSRRPKGGGELAWALARFEMGCERATPLEALTDYLLALRALLEPEGPSSGHLPQRLAVICAAAEDRALLAERTGDAVSLERALMGGIAPRNDNHAVAVVEELAEHLRADPARRAVWASGARPVHAGRRSAGRGGGGGRGCVAVVGAGGARTVRRRRRRRRRGRPDRPAPPSADLVRVDGRVKSRCGRTSAAVLARCASEAVSHPNGCLRDGVLTHRPDPEGADGRRCGTGGARARAARRGSPPGVKADAEPVTATVTRVKSVVQVAMPGCEADLTRWASKNLG